MPSPAMVCWLCMLAWSPTNQSYCRTGWTYTWWDHCMLDKTKHMVQSNTSMCNMLVYTNMLWQQKNRVFASYGFESVLHSSLVLSGVTAQTANMQDRRHAMHWHSLGGGPISSCWWCTKRSTVLYCLLHWRQVLAWVTQHILVTLVHHAAKFEWRSDGEGFVLYRWETLTRHPLQASQKSSMLATNKNNKIPQKRFQYTCIQCSKLCAKS